MKFIDAFDRVFLDCDSTLVTIEGIDELAALHGKKREIERLTKAAMDGLISFEAVYEERLSLICPRKEDLREVGRKYIATIVPGVREFVQEVQRQGKEVHIVSGGYTLPIQMLATHLGIPLKHVHAVDLFFDEKGNYTSFDTESPLAKSGGKRATVQRLSEDGKSSVFIGDGSTDLEAKGCVDLMVGFGFVHQRARVRQESDLFVTGDFFSLTKLELPSIRSG